MSCLLVLFIPSCASKEKEVLTKKEILCLTEWKVEQVLLNDGAYSNLAFPSQKKCYRDNLFMFFLNDSMVIREGETKCDPSLPDNYPGGVYFLDVENKSFVMNGNNFHLLHLENDSFVFERQFLWNGESLKETFYLFRD